MKRLLICLSLMLAMAAAANANFTAVGGTLSVNGDAYASGGPSSYDSNSASNLTISNSISAWADSMGTAPSDGGGTDPYDPYNPGGTDPYDPYNPGGTDPYDPYNPGGTDPGMFSLATETMVNSSAMADTTFTLREDGFYLAGNGSATIMSGSGNASFSNQSNFSFELLNQSVCDILATTYYEFVSDVSNSAYAEIEIKNLANERVLFLNSADGSIDTELTLDAGVYYVYCNSYGSAYADGYAADNTWDSTGNYSIDLTATAVPEPATLAILGAGLLFVRRKK